MENFWKTVKPMLSNKFINNEKITLVDNEKIITNDKEVAKVLNEFFSNIIKTLNIPNKDDTDSIRNFKKNNNFMAPFKDGVQLPQGYSHFKEAVYFLTFSSQKLLLLILSTSEG